AGSNVARRKLTVAPVETFSRAARSSDRAAWPRGRDRLPAMTVISSRANGRRSGSTPMTWALTGLGAALDSTLPIPVKRVPATPNDIDRRVPNQGHGDFLPLTSVNGPHRIIPSGDRPEARPIEPRNPSDTVRAGRARAARGQARELLKPIVVHLAPADDTPLFPRKRAIRPALCDRGVRPPSDGRKGEGRSPPVRVQVSPPPSPPSPLRISRN